MVMKRLAIDLALVVVLALLRRGGVVYVGDSGGRPDLFRRYTGTMKERLACMTDAEAKAALRRGDFSGELGGR